MRLDEVNDGQIVIIKGFNVNDQLKDRFCSFGLNKNKKIKKMKSSLGGSTVLIELDRSCVILRIEEAKCIEVEIVNE